MSYPPEIHKKVIEMYTTPAIDGTWTGTQTIAKTLGLYQATVYNILKVHGIKTRSRKEWGENGKVCKPIKNLPVGTPPPCKCGCGDTAAWNQRKNGWNVYIVGHQHKHALYKDKEWLEREYVINKRTASQISDMFEVSGSSIIRWLKHFGIPIRKQSESLVLSGAVKGKNNPAWKGGIAKWNYASGWKRIARQIRLRDNYTCQTCGTVFEKTSKVLHVHHKDGDKLNNDPTNLVCVCATCHPKGKRKEGWTRKNPPPPRQFVVTRRGEIFGFDPDKWISTRAASDQIGLTPGHLVNLGQRDLFTIRKQGGFWYIEVDSFQKFTRTHTRHKHY